MNVFRITTEPGREFLVVATNFGEALVVADKVLTPEPASKPRWPSPVEEIESVHLLGPVAGRAEQ